jgi:hypothetical protein
MKRYYTGLLVHPYEELPRPLNGRGWGITIERKLDDDVRRAHTSDPTEIVIHAKTAERAQAVLTLILDSWTVINGVLPAADDLTVIPEEDEEREQEESDSLFNPREAWSNSGFTLSCLIAQRASMKRKFVYATALCRQSFALHANDVMELVPGAFPYQHRSMNPRDHVRFAYAIVTAYAALEQLGLSLHGECFRKGVWIKEKKEDLERRLKKAGINLTVPLLWTLRGGRTRLEAKRPPTMMRKCKWSHGQVRDCEVDFVDAIADLRWFRSRVGAHDVDSFASVLSVHDVANAQGLARRAILESMGFTKERIRGFYKGIEERSEQPLTPDETTHG